MIYQEFPQRASPDGLRLSRDALGVSFYLDNRGLVGLGSSSGQSHSFGSAQLSDEAFEEMPFRGIGIMDDDQRAALIGAYRTFGL